MCSAPKMAMPAPVVPPPAEQAAKDADIASVRKKNATGATGLAGGTLLTGGTGAAPTNVGGATLLGQ